MSSTTETTAPPARDLAIRAAGPADTEVCGRIFYEAFASIANRHGLPIEPGSPDFTHFAVDQMLGTEGILGLVAERDGEIVGSAFVDERGSIAGIGPVTVDPAVQDAGVGRALMEALMGREREREAAGIRLVQTAYHYRSFALYAKLGFTVRELLTVVQGTPPELDLPGYDVRQALEEDLGTCSALCEQVHGHAREGELRGAIAAGSARVVERRGQLSGYATDFGYGWHAVARTNEDLIALLSSADSFVGLGVLVPARNRRLLAWCLGRGLRIVQQSTLMTVGLYNEPAGAWLPSIVY